MAMSIKLEPELELQIREVAEKTERTKTGVIRLALKKYFSEVQNAESRDSK